MSAAWFRCVIAVLALLATSKGALAQQQTGLRVTAEGLSLDFQDADLRLVIAALADAGGLNVAYGDLPAKRITLRTATAIERTQVPALLRSLAESNGLIVREDAGFFRIDVAPTAATTLRNQSQDSAQEETRLFVYRLKHARAARLAATLQSLFGGPATQFQPGLSRAPLSERLREQRLPPADTAGRPRVDVSVTTAQQPGLPGQLQGSVQIVADESSNSLLVRAQPSDYEIVRQAVDALDLRPLQVLIEVIIAEVRRTKDVDIGISAQGQNQSGSRKGELKSTAPSDVLFRISERGTINLDLAFSALATTGDVRILSRPVVLAQNNQEARILIGAERPFVQVFRSLPTDAGVRDQVVQYRDVGTSLTILPTINPDGYVNLQVTQEVSTATSETQFGAPVISTREASTHLLARHGQTVVIGGLIDHQQDRTRGGVPILKEIPLIGVLFGTTRVRDGNSELFLFLTPRIIATDDEADRLREEIERRPGLLQKLGPIRPLVPDSVRPIRPDTIRK